MHVVLILFIILFIQPALYAKNKENDCNVRYVYTGKFEYVDALECILIMHFVNVYLLLKLYGVLLFSHTNYCQSTKLQIMRSVNFAKGCDLIFDTSCLGKYICALIIQTTFSQYVLVSFSPQHIKQVLNNYSAIRYLVPPSRLMI